MRPIHKSSFLNRCRKVVDEWRQMYDSRPPPMSDAHPHWRLISEDRRYETLLKSGRSAPPLKHLISARYPLFSSSDFHRRPPPPALPSLTLISFYRLPRTESLADTADRVMELWQREVAPLVRAGKRVLVVGHRNSLRALIRNLEVRARRLTFSSFFF